VLPTLYCLSRSTALGIAGVPGSRLVTPAASLLKGRRRGFRYVIPTLVTWRHGLGTARRSAISMLTATCESKGTRKVQADSGSDSDSESRRRSVRRLPAGWDRRVEADYRRWLQTSRNNGTDKLRRCSSAYCFRKCSLEIGKREKLGSWN